MVILDQQTRSERQTGCSEQHTNRCNSAEFVQQSLQERHKMDLLAWNREAASVERANLSGSRVRYD